MLAVGDIKPFNLSGHDGFLPDCLALVGLNSFYLSTIGTLMKGVIYSTTFCVL